VGARSFGGALAGKEGNDDRILFEKELSSEKEGRRPQGVGNMVRGKSREFEGELRFSWKNCAVWGGGLGTGEKGIQAEVPL